MRTIRNSILAALFAAQAVFANGRTAHADDPIDRRELVTRHNVVVHELDPNGAMAVGNGEFAFNFDVTGLQSFPEFYEKTMPIGILSNWGWHNFPNPEGYSLDRFKMTVIKRHDREFVYPAASTSNPPPDAAYLRANPHRFGLGRIGLAMTHADGSEVTIRDLQHIDQRFDLWGGIVTSSFEVDGVPVHVTTAVHSERDEVATVVESPLIQTGRLKLRIAFPYALNSFGPDYQDWNHPDAHQTVLTRREGNAADFARTLDATQYQVRTKWSDRCGACWKSASINSRSAASRIALNSPRGFRHGRSKGKPTAPAMCNKPRGNIGNSIGPLAA